jgi:predicted metal-dependent enzyme (double-stranded beta helix superfamily)
MKFSLEGFVEECKAARDLEEMTAVVRRAVERRGEVLAAIGRAEEQATTTLYASPTLTVQWLAWAPGMRAPAHEHRMWSVLGVCAGCEENGTYRRTEGGVERMSATPLREGDVLAMPDDVIHDVRNPLDAFTVSLHVYGGDILHAPRSFWSPFTGREEPFDTTRVEWLTREFNERQRREPVPFTAASVPRIMTEIFRDAGLL